MGNFLLNFLDWDRDFYNFSRSIKDMHPYEVIRKENQCTIVFNALGISKDNIDVSFDKSRGTDFLLISGEQKNDVTDKNYSVNARFSVDVNEIDNVEWHVQDGLLYVIIQFKQAEKPQVPVRYKG